MGGFEVIRRASEAPSPCPPVPSSSRLHKAKEKKHNPGLNRARMRRPETTTTDKNATAHKQYHVTVCHERLSQGRGAVLNTTKECFCKSTFVSNPNLCPAVEASSLRKGNNPYLTVIQCTLSSFRSMKGAPGNTLGTSLFNTR